MALLDNRKTLSREKRNGALSHYHGTLASLLEDSPGTELPQRVRTFSQSTPGEILYALRVTSGIGDAAVVIHGAVGCAASGLFFNAEQKGSWYSTNLNESDTILGGDGKLRAALLRAYNEVSPKIIFIVGTPINAINNDDVNSVIREMGDELDSKIVYIEVNGFKTKNSLTGYDVVSHALLKNLVEPKQRWDFPFLNLISTSENPDDVAAAAELLRRLDIPFNILPQFSCSRGIRMAGSAIASISLNDSENEYLATGLEEQFGVPFVKTPVPIGSAAIRNFLKKAAAQFDRIPQAEALIQDEERTANVWMGKNPFAGKRIFIDMDLHAAVSFSALVEELGGEVSALALPNLDSRNSAKLKDLALLSRALPVVVAQGQQFEIANILAKHPADFYIGKSENAVTAARFGAYPLATDGLALYGYAGIRELLRRARRLEQDTGYAAILKRGAGAPYSAAWLKKSGNWHIKLEVK
jgi:nitrogenase molybdenum-iron protein alpha chain